MTHNSQDISCYRFNASDTLLLDTNIWLFLYGPQRQGDRRVAIYSAAFARILQAQSRIYIDVLIVSEFINAYARLKWKQAAPSTTDFKQFRKSADFKPIAQDIAADVRQVLRHCTRMESGFETLAIDAVIDDFGMGESDFNDQILVSLCQAEGLKLVTDDGDFKGCIPVVTANKRLLA